VAHELFFENGKASMFYVDEPAWHGLGTRLEQPPATAEEAIEAAGLNWEVAKVPVYVSGIGRLFTLEHQYATVRKDHLDHPDCHPFGLVGDKYQPLQNIDAFRFFDPLLQERDVRFETAGALGQGERIWVMVRFEQDISVGSDVLQRYLLLSNRHDGRGSVTLKFTPIRVVCQNTLSAALFGEGRAFQVRHDRALHDRLKEARMLIQTIRDTYARLQAAFEDLRALVLKADMLKTYLEAVFPLPSQPADESVRTRVLRNRSAAAHFAHYGKGNSTKDVRDTMWAAYNGVVEFVDHRKTNPRAADVNDSRLRYVWFGGGAVVKQRALVTALRMVESKQLALLPLD
jgi:phage/plasmid-like protein (TIGR03299 family)